MLFLSEKLVQERKTSSGSAAQFNKNFLKLKFGKIIRNV